MGVWAYGRPVRITPIRPHSHTPIRAAAGGRAMRRVGFLLILALAPLSAPAHAQGNGGPPPAGTGPRGRGGYDRPAASPGAPRTWDRIQLQYIDARTLAA